MMESNKDANLVGHVKLNESIEQSGLMNIQSDGDSLNGEEELSAIIHSASLSRAQGKKKRHFYRQLVKKVNSFGGIRKVFLQFIQQRRAILIDDAHKSQSSKVDDYFKCCIKNV